MSAESLSLILIGSQDVERQQVEAPNGQHAEPDNARQVEAPDVGQGPLDWEMAHAYYASMGGFTFGAEGRVDFPFSSRATLTPTGLRVLAKYASDLIPRVTASEIKDKSKADSVAKLLLCTQIVWFFLQCITRLAQGLSISLLELNTLAHATCALFVYIQWWSKPLNILEPSEIGKEDKDKEKAGQFWCLLHLVSSIPIAEEVQNTGRGFLSRESPLKFSYEMNPDGASPEWQDLQPRKTTWSLPSFAHCPLLPKFGAFGEYSDDPPPRPDRPNEQRGVRLGVGKQLHNITLRRNARTNPDPNAHKRPTIQQRPSVNYIDLSKAEVDCWKLASMALKVCQEDDNCASLKRLTRYPSIRPRAKNWPSERSEAFNESVGLYFQLIAFGLASAIFGGLHLVAWDAYFPSHMEMFLWKISALAICSLGPVLLAGNSLVLLSRYRDDTGSIFVWVLCTGAWLLALVCSVCYVALYSFARVYILVACFANLVHLPDSAFEVPSWSQYFPHIS